MCSTGVVQDKDIRPIFYSRELWILMWRVTQVITQDNNQSHLTGQNMVVLKDKGTSKFY